MCNENLLRKKIDENGLKIRFVAEKIGVSYQALLNKMRNKTEFVATEMMALKKLLDLNDDEFQRIFFAVTVE